MGLTEGRRLLAVLAHPDDESLGVGGTLAKYALEGVEVFLLTATRGDAGRDRGHRPGAPDHPGAAALATIREAELGAAAAALGVRDVSLLDYHDRRLDEADPREVVAIIARHLRLTRPDVVVTFGPDGAYGHPDHIAISQFTTAAVVAAADPHHRAIGRSGPRHRVIERSGPRHRVIERSGPRHRVIERSGHRRSPDSPSPDGSIARSPDSRSPDSRSPDSRSPDDSIAQSPDSPSPDSRSPDDSIARSPDSPSPDSRSPDDSIAQSPDSPSPDSPSPDSPSPDSPSPDSPSPDGSIARSPDSPSPDGSIARSPDSPWAAYQTAIGRLSSSVDGVERYVTPWPDWAITTRIDTRHVWTTVSRAISCHDSQVAAYEGLKDLSPAHHVALWGSQSFYRAFSTVNGGRAPETDLFEGIPMTTSRPAKQESGGG